MGRICASTSSLSLHKVVVSTRILDTINVMQNKAVFVTFFLFLTFMLVTSCESLPSTPPPTAQAAFVIESSTVIVIPGPGNYFPNAQDGQSTVVLMNISVEMGVCDKDYTPWRDPPVQYKQGDPCIIITGEVLNTDKENTDIVIWADGLDAEGDKVSWTLDAYHLIGRTGLRLEYGEIGQFTLHLNPDVNLCTIKLYSVMAHY